MKEQQILPLQLFLRSSVGNRAEIDNPNSSFLGIVYEAVLNPETKNLSITIRSISKTLSFDTFTTSFRNITVSSKSKFLALKSGGLRIRIYYP